MFSYVLRFLSGRGQPVSSDSSKQKASVSTTSSTQSTSSSDQKDTGDSEYVPSDDDSLEDFDTQATQTQKCSDGRKRWNGTISPPPPPPSPSHLMNGHAGWSKQGAIRDLFTISSPTRTLKWPGCNPVQITCNTSTVYHVQVSCYVPLGTKGLLSY